MSRAAARFIGRLAVHLFPAGKRHWARAMAAEIDAIGSARIAMFFALGCLGCAIREAFIHHLLHPLALPLAGAGGALAEGRGAMEYWNRLIARPQALAVLCGTAATLLGLAYLAMAGAPPRYLAMNGGALLIGLLLGAGLLTLQRWGTHAGVMNVAIAAALLITGLFGSSADGATRWVHVGGIVVQPSLILVPVLVLSFACRGDRLSAAAVAVAALGLALQPDRAMAGALTGGLAALALVRRQPRILAALAAAAAGLAATLLRPDQSRAAPYVDGILYTSSDVSPVAGLMVLAGAVLMLVPAFITRHSGQQQAATLAFGGVWLAILVAAALGNYPTPLVGYGGSAILGYLIGAVLLPAQPVAKASSAAAPVRATDDENRGYRGDVSLAS